MKSAWRARGRKLAGSESDALQLMHFVICNAGEHSWEATLRARAALQNLSPAAVPAELSYAMGDANQSNCGCWSMASAAAQGQ